MSDGTSTRPEAEEAKFGIEVDLEFQWAVMLIIFFPGGSSAGMEEAGKYLVRKGWRNEHHSPLGGPQLLSAAPR